MNEACNTVSRIAFDQAGISNAVRLHALAYDAAGVVARSDRGPALTS